ncbi:hypothetical protein DSO57_1016988 [Entomophthora muscae]|uniref:Uncharacterized protein n=1 Tax=Entomophthora muscae TaxID=34485 RepID=A0ACC2RJ85_9FUNG|nr:hypothetical protein DSO57_1016988 [Entomophthora muscae]
MLFLTYLFLAFPLINGRPTKLVCGQGETPMSYRPSQVFHPTMRDPKGKQDCDINRPATRIFKTIHNQCRPPSEKGQCTEWADGRFFQLTGKNIPFRGPANSWPAQARNASSTWIVSETPIVPSVIITPPGIHGAGVNGHAAILEYKYASGEICTTNWNAPSLARLSLIKTRHFAGMSYITLRK